MKSHYYLACCEIVFVDKEGSTGVTRLNTMIKTEFNYISVRNLAHAQQAAQMQLFDKIGEHVNVLNVIIISINYIGHMTDEEFNTSPTEEPNVVSKLN